MSVSGIGPSAQGDASAATREARSSALACAPLPAAGLPGHLVAGIASRVVFRLEPRFKWLQARESNPRHAEYSPLLYPTELACGGSRFAPARYTRSRARRRERVPAGFSSPDRCREIEGAILPTARLSHRTESWFPCGPETTRPRLAAANRGLLKSLYRWAAARARPPGTRRASPSRDPVARTRCLHAGARAPS